MSRATPTTMAKRNRERAQKEKQEIKRAERAYRREQKKQRRADGGIIPKSNVPEIEIPPE